MDIEVSVTHGSMNIGIFGPEHKIDTVGAKEAVSVIVNELITARDIVRQVI